MANLLESIQKYLPPVLAASQQLEGKRIAILEQLSTYIIEKKKKEDPIELVFICTHNSRRSHLSQIWAQVAAAYYTIEGISTFSGGTEATAFNPRAVAAMQRAGFEILNPGGENPKYEVTFSKDQAPLISYSKTYDDEANPSSKFAAVMTCSEADEACPMVLGMDKRIALHYEDPKEADDTDQESQRYDERCLQIASELFFVMKKVSEVL